LAVIKTVYTKNSARIPTILGSVLISPKSNFGHGFESDICPFGAQAGLSQEELGEQSGLTRNYIGMIERGETSPTLDAVEAIALALGKPAKEML